MDVHSKMVELPGRLGSELRGPHWINTGYFEHQSIAMNINKHEICSNL